MKTSWDSGPFSLKKRKLKAPYRGHQVPKGVYQRAGEEFFPRAYSDRTMGNSGKLKEGRFRLDIRKKFFTLSAMRHWNRLARDAVDSSSWNCSRLRWMGPWATWPSWWCCYTWQGVTIICSLRCLPIQAFNDLSQGEFHVTSSGVLHKGCKSMSLVKTRDIK